MTKHATRYCNCNHPSIEEKAEALQEADDEATSKSIFSFVRDTIQYNIRRKMKGAVQVLESEEGMCFDKTNLLIALHRANDIPSRYRQLNCELAVHDEDLPAEAPLHLVADVKIDNTWITLDPSFDPSTKSLISPADWGDPSWRSVNSEKRYDELPIYLPFVVNYILVPFAPDVKTIQRKIDTLR